MNNIGHPECPYCGTELDDEQLWYHGNDIEVSVGDGDQSSIICPNDAILEHHAWQGRHKSLILFVLTQNLLEL